MAAPRRAPASVVETRIPSGNRGTSFQEAPTQEEEGLDIFGEPVSAEAVAVASQEEEIAEAFEEVAPPPLVSRVPASVARKFIPAQQRDTNPFTPSRPTPGYKQEQPKGKLVTITGLFKNAKSLGGKTMKRVMGQTYDIHEGTRFVVLPNTYKKKDSDPAFKLFISEDGE